MILDEIIKNKQEEVGKLTAPKVKKPEPCRSLAQALKDSGQIKLIAEIKKQSPSAGIIREDFNPRELAKTYEQAGASALSVLTDKKFFGGSLEDLKAARYISELPVLRKDFIISEKQIYESKAAGADAILLIVKVLGLEKLRQFLETTKKLKMEAFVEVHNSDEVEIVFQTDAQVIGINNRDLQSFHVDFQNTLNLIKKYPELKQKILVSESGIKHSKHVQELHQAGVSAVLVGESLLKSKDIPAKISELIS